ncbi:MAG: hypothetical protein OEV91_06055 [Desulfobulbaceae bacterium]|nr:hypothetical protein [Desulfobulbaceae bacterium]
MKKPDDIWDDIGELSEVEMFHVITKLFDLYYADLERDPTDRQARDFFRKLDLVVTQTGQCNLNRR